MTASRRNTPRAKAQGNETTIGSETARNANDQASTGNKSDQDRAPADVVAE